MMTYDVMKYDFMTYDVMKYNFMTYDVMKYDFMTYDIMKYVSLGILWLLPPCNHFLNKELNFKFSCEK